MFNIKTLTIAAATLGCSYGFSYAQNSVNSDNAVIERDVSSASYCALDFQRLIDGMVAAGSTGFLFGSANDVKPFLDADNCKTLDEIANLMAALASN